MKLNWITFFLGLGMQSVGVPQSQILPRVAQEGRGESGVRLQIDMGSGNTRGSWGLLHLEWCQIQEFEGMRFQARRT